MSEQLYVVERKFDDDEAAVEKKGVYQLDPDANLKDTRAKLGDFMRAADRFLLGDAPVNDAAEATMQLSAIATTNGDGKDSVAFVLTGKKKVVVPTREVDPGTYEVELDSEDMPEHTADTDQLGNEGLDGGDKTEDITDLAKLLLAKNGKQRVRFLVLNQIYKNGRTTAWVMDRDGELEPARERSARAAKVRLATSDKVRIDHAVSSYEETEHEWWKQTAASGKFSGGVPTIFSIKGSYKHVQSQFSFQKGVKIHQGYTQLIPKVRLQLRDVTMNDAFTRAVEQALEDRTPAEALLDVLAGHGHFVARDIVVGGKLTLERTKTLTERFDESKESNEFKTAVDASLATWGYPVSGGAGAGGGQRDHRKDKEIAQRANLKLEVFGGDPSLASSKQDKAGVDWIGSLGPFSQWRRCGFYSDSLVPTIELLPAALRDGCKKVLREYFNSQLRLQQTRRIGNDQKTWFDAVQSDGAISKQIEKLHFRFDRLLDSVRTELVMSDGKRWVSPWRGNQSRPKFEVGFTLRPGEDIVAMDVGWDRTVDAVIFHTSHDRQFPRDAPFEGMAHYDGIGSAYGGPHAARWETVAAPRVRGLYGTAAAFIDSLGLQYFELASSAKARAFLLAIEPYLFG